MPYSFEDDDHNLRWAAENGHLGVVKYLVDSGANINVNDNNALRLAVQDDHLEVVKYLLDHNADIYANDEALR